MKGFNRKRTLYLLTVLEDDNGVGTLVCHKLSAGTPGSMEENQTAELVSHFLLFPETRILDNLCLNHSGLYQQKETL